MVVRVVLSQILFTGYQSVAVVSAVALFIGATIILQIQLLAPAVGGELLGQVMVAAVLRELAPLGTAFLVAGRSGTAIATELGGMKVGQEVLALASLGIDPPRYLVLPRLLGVMVSVLALMAYFIVVAIAGGYLVAWLITAPSFDAMRAGVALALMPADAVLYVAKGLGLGVLIGWLCCHYGLSVQISPTEVPQQASRAVMLDAAVLRHLQHARDGPVLRDRRIAGAGVSVAAVEGLSAREVTFRYGDVVVLDQESFHVPRGRDAGGDRGQRRGQVDAPLPVRGAGRRRRRGRSGSTVTLPNVARPSDLVRRGVRTGFVFQQGGLVSNLNVVTNVKLALRYHADVLGLTEEAIEERAREALDRVRIGESELYSLPAHLSFGTRKRVALARAIALRPNFAFFDDPDAGLDSATSAVVRDLILACRDDPTITTLVCTNHRLLLDAIGTYPKELCNGQLLAQTYGRVE